MSSHDACGAYILKNWQFSLVHDCTLVRAIVDAKYLIFSQFAGVAFTDRLVLAFVVLVVLTLLICCEEVEEDKAFFFSEKSGNDEGEERWCDVVDDADFSGFDDKDKDWIRRECWWGRSALLRGLGERWMLTWEGTCCAFLFFDLTIVGIFYNELLWDKRCHNSFNILHPHH